MRQGRLSDIYEKESRIIFLTLHKLLKMGCQIWPDSGSPRVKKNCRTARIKIELGGYKRTACSRCIERAPQRLKTIFKHWSS